MSSRPRLFRRGRLRRGARRAVEKQHNGTNASVCRLASSPVATSFRRVSQNKVLPEAFFALD